MKPDRPRSCKGPWGRNAEPSASVLDSQTVKTSANVHLAGQGTDAGKRIIGRKRHLGGCVGEIGFWSNFCGALTLCNLPGLDGPS
ncbi:hypothetical protein GCM10018779_58370 [Streptomyces griseocarneus]|nr:hypothetical protein GCM10018779_58370 [Streptomyces griseocarneus]